MASGAGPGTTGSDEKRWHTDDAFILTQLGATEALTSAGADGQVHPALAGSWVQVDPLTWRFVLRSGVTFHDGTPLTPAAVVTALGYVTAVAAPPRALRGLGLTVVEDGANAVRIATTRPDPILPQRMSSPNTAILAPAAYAGAAPSVIGTGTGPMKLTAVEGAQRAVLERFDGYWGGRPALARVTATFVTDPAARALALRGCPSRPCWSSRRDPGTTSRRSPPRARSRCC